MEYTRRNLLRTAGMGAIGVSGCLSGGEANGEKRSEDTEFIAGVSFPVIHDFVANVVPENADANSLVPIGQHGHGWEPSPNIQREVSNSDAFVYVFDGFQPWADDMVTNVRRDHPDVAVVKAGAGVEMIEARDDGHGDDNDHEGGGSHREGGDEHHENHQEDEHHEGEKHDHEEGGEHEKDQHDHEQGDVDPHFWLDPLRAKTAIDNVAEGLGEADEDEGYDENAREYKSELDGLHEEFEEVLSEASQGAVLIAGHNAFQYLGERYGFEVVTLTGVTPDEQPDPQDIQRAQGLIDENDIGYVLSPVFESDTAAEGLVRDTTAQKHLPVTAFASFRQDWLDKDWGYTEVMRNVNLASLERALEA